MNKTAWTIVCLIGAIAMAAIAIASATLGGCAGQLQLAEGGSAPMKCHWAFVADTFIGILGAIIALLGIACTEASGRRASAISLIACAAIAALIPTSMAIGICAMSDMHCHETARIVWVLCAIAAIVGIIQAVKANPDTAKLPKRTL